LWLKETLQKYFELDLMNFSSKFGDFPKMRIGIRIEEKDGFWRKRRNRAVKQQSCLYAFAQRIKQKREEARKNSRMVTRPIYA
jgi:hypothetical protein